MQDLNTRTRRFAMAVSNMTNSLPKRGKGEHYADQVFRSGTSAGSHWHEATRAKSDADMISKIEGALQELAETDYWLDLIGQEGLIPQETIAELRQEAGELTAILITIVKKRREAMRKAKAERRGGA